MASPPTGSGKANGKATAIAAGTTLAFHSQNNPIGTTSAGSAKRSVTGSKPSFIGSGLFNRSPPGVAGPQPGQFASIKPEVCHAFQQRAPADKQLTDSN